MLITSELFVRYYPDQETFLFDAPTFPEISGYYKMTKEKIKLVLEGQDFVLPVVSTTSGDIVDAISIKNKELKDAIIASQL